MTSKGEMWRLSFNVNEVTYSIFVLSILFSIVSSHTPQVLIYREKEKEKERERERGREGGREGERDIITYMYMYT